MKATRVFAAAVALLALSVVGPRAEEWKVDKAHSSVGFTVKHMLVAKVNGKFTDFDGTVDLDRGDMSKSKVAFTIKTASINTDNERRDGHLKSGDFFLVDSFPDITFSSTQVIPTSDTQYKLVGNLTIRGVTKEVTFECTNNGFLETPQADRAGFTATTTINRMDYGVKWDKTLDGGGLVVGTDVNITVELEIVKPKPEAKG